MDDTPPVATIPRALVDAMFKAYSMHDFRTFAYFLADDIEWTVSGPVDILPFCGTKRGKLDVIDLIAHKIPAVMRITSFDRESILIDGDQVAVLSRVTARRTSDGRQIGYRLATFMRFSGTKLVKNLSFLDSFDAAEQVLGRSLGLSDDDGELDDVIAF